MNIEDVQHWNTNASLWKITDYSTIEVGNYILGEFPEIREGLLVKHIIKTDTMLEKLPIDSPQYLIRLKTRFISFAEYLSLLESHLPTSGTNSGKAYSKISVHAKQYFELLKKSKYSSLLFDTADHEKNYLELFKLFLPHAKDFFFSGRPVPLKLKDLERHAVITGKSGSGKTELMKALFMQIQKHTHEKQQASLVFLDVHGDVTESLLTLRLNQQKPERLIYIEPSFSRDKVPSINPFYHKISDPVTADLMCQQFCKAFMELMGDAGLSLHMEVLLKPCLYVLMSNGNFGLSNLLDFFDDNRNEELIELGKKSSHHTYRVFFESAFSNKKYALTKLSIYSRLQSLLNHYVFYQMLNGKPTIDWEKALNEGKVILINLSKGKIGEQSSKALGKLIAATLLSITLKRAFQPESKRKKTFLFVDEFHNFASETFETIFSESRKYCLFLVCASQAMTQFPVSLRDMILNCTAVKLLGINGMPALKAQAGDFGLSYSQLQELEPYYFYLKVDHYKTLKIKSPDFLLKHPKHYFLLPKEIKSLKEYCLNQSGAYRPADTTVSELSKNNLPEKQTAPEKKEPEPSSSSYEGTPSQTKKIPTKNESSPKEGIPVKYKL
ncbi:type IV secretory system conjugative DNA transfer family protein [Chryseobacterium oryctis]|uniref:Type IV secretion system DNA-binding domain-containing protein n=1 Tax=Chryseobacterium oryctis TaxID=2952618 RepID=A0ABT3HIP8_9FLAO|nr:DUF87 domain-containing protein [Chryseobacterium oryctis]MCW3159666.1 type IV secretion system DNA-binding domain-containing protein [Chryseobacterium oryctis]